MVSNDRVEWFYCLDHGTVEPRIGCRDEVRLGPFRSREEAERALEIVERRNQQWDKDPAWREDD